MPFLKILNVGSRCLIQGTAVQSKRQVASFRSKDPQFTNTKQTDFYAQYRPRYTEEVFKTITDYVAESSTDFDLAVDVGCGTGQSTVALAKKFKKVIGLDISDVQIAKAPSNIQNATFKVCPGEDLSVVQTGTADLVTAAQAFHWMDQHRFFAESDRVLKPGGSLVIYGYGTCGLLPREANDYFQEFYESIMCDYWVGGRKCVHEKYMNFSLPYEGWKRNDSMAIQRKLRVEEFIGYLKSSSAFTDYHQKNPTKNVYETAHQRLSNICQSLQGPDGDKQMPRLLVSWPVFMLMGHKPT